jgi:hypothetical protein
MQNRHGNKIKALLISTLLVIGLVANPARADHEHSDNDLIAPLAGILVLGALLNHNHNYNHKRSKRYYGHYGNHGYRQGHRNGYRQGHRNGHRQGHRNGHRNGHLARSYSSEGYGRKSKRNHRR